jgi:hypothetical protein
MAEICLKKVREQEGSLYLRGTSFSVLLRTSAWFRAGEDSPVPIEMVRLL